LTAVASQHKPYVNRQTAQVSLNSSRLTLINPDAQTQQTSVPAQSYQFYYPKVYGSSTGGLLVIDESS
jgi:hypothetical protein